MKTRTPFSSVILYIFGIIFLIVAGFMLVTAINYNKVYLASYETTFEEMWSNSVQYIIEKFLPYFGVGVICIGIGKAISVFKKAQGAVANINQGPRGTAATYASKVKDSETEPENIQDLSRRLKELREVGSIKLEEMERREKVRLEDLRENVVRDMAIHRLQREAKEEEIISKLNALGEKMGLDMMELYAKADIPVVPETEPQASLIEESGSDSIGDDPLFDELDKADAAGTDQIDGLEVEEVEATDEVESMDNVEVEETKEDEIVEPVIEAEDETDEMTDEAKENDESEVDEPDDKNDDEADDNGYESNEDQGDDDDKDSDDAYEHEGADEIDELNDDKSDDNADESNEDQDDNADESNEDQDDDADESDEGQDDDADKYGDGDAGDADEEPEVAEVTEGVEEVEATDEAGDDNEVPEGAEAADEPGGENEVTGDNDGSEADEDQGGEEADEDQEESKNAEDNSKKNSKKKQKKNKKKKHKKNRK